MATVFVPHLNYFKEEVDKFPEPFKLDHKWMIYADKAFEGQSMFAEFNQAVLEFIHFEKRFPNKEEFEDIRHKTLPNELFTFNEVADILQEEPIPWNGICWKDFVKDEEAPETALKSTTGINKHTLNHRLI